MQKTPVLTTPQGIPRPSTTSASAVPTSSSQALPKNFGMIIYRGYEMLDVFGPLDALGLLARSYQLNLYLISETMDPVTVQPVSAAMNPKNSSFVRRARLTRVTTPPFSPSYPCPPGVSSSAPAYKLTRSLL